MSRRLAECSWPRVQEDPSQPTAATNARPARRAQRCPDLGPDGLGVLIGQHGQQFRGWTEGRTDDPETLAHRAADGVEDTLRQARGLGAVGELAVEVINEPPGRRN